MQNIIKDRSLLLMKQQWRLVWFVYFIIHTCKCWLGLVISIYWSVVLYWFRILLTSF